MKYKNIGKKTKFEKIWQYGKLQQFKQKHKCEKMACKYKTMRIGERSEKHK